MRLTLLFIALPTLAAAWEFSPAPICTLSHAEAGAELVITHDPGLQEYRLDVTRPGAWAASPTFGMAFQGGRGFSIGTDRHAIAGDTLTVRDSGFGNVLYGLEYNASAAAFTASQFIEVSLDGAAEPVRQFRDCAARPPATS